MLNNISETLKRFKGVDYRESSILDANFYISDDIFRLEKEKIFFHSWHMVCRLEDIANPGDYFCDTYLGEKIFILHGSDGEIRAFGNVCRHRWTPLLEGQGKIKNNVIMCPYHHWCYNYKGKLIGAPDVKGLEKFSTDINGLHEIRIHIWNKFVFITMSKETDDFFSYIGDYDELISPYHNNLMCVRRTNYNISANWKGYIEVDMETYHTPSVHPSSIGVQYVDILNPSGQYIGVYHACEDTIAIQPENRHLGFPHIEGLTGTQKKGTHFCVILPSLFIVNTLDSMWWIYKVPISANKTEVRCGFCFPEETTKRPDFDKIVPHYYKRWDAVIEEDNWIVERQYQGILSEKFATLGRYANSEPVVFDFDLWVLEQLSK